MERRTAISGLIPARPLRMADSVFRLTPRASAACVTVTPRGSRQSVLMISPGWGGLCMRMGTAPSVIVLVIDTVCLANEVKRHAPVPAHRHGQGAVAVTPEPMKLQPGQRHVLR